MVLGHKYSPTLLFGIALTWIGAFFLQYRRGGQFFQDPQTLGIAFMAMAGHGVAALADAKAMQSIEPMVLMFWVNILVIVFCGAYFALRRPPHRSRGLHLLAAWRTAPMLIIAVAVMSYMSYLMILIAFQFGGDVAAVVGHGLGCVVHDVPVVEGGREGEFDAALCQGGPPVGLAGDSL